MPTSEFLHPFETSTRSTVVALPFPLDRLLDAWDRLRVGMIGKPPAEFSRPEWAYLISFLSRDNLESAFLGAFGERARGEAGLPTRMARPRGSVAVWLPNNVSLLGPLVLILLSLTGNRVRAKVGTRSEDLVGPFLEFLRSHAPAGPLAEFAEQRLTYERFDRADPRNEEMARDADLRVVFGSDEGAAAVEALPHPLWSTGVVFSDRRSEVWVESGRRDDQVYVDVLKAFSIYGRAGCTSPSKVVLLDGTEADARAFRDRLCELWAAVTPGPPPMNVASVNIMGAQWAAALGWSVVLTESNGAVLASGAPDTPPVDVPMFLPVVACSEAIARSNLPANIQTIGLAATRPCSVGWLHLLAGSRVKRLVPIEMMHHFGPTWDGYDFWRQSFEEIEIIP